MHKSERVEGFEPSSSAWKAEIISPYTIPALIYNIIVSNL